MQTEEKVYSEVSVAADFENLYRQSFPAVARVIHRWGGSIDDAKDVFQDAVVILYEKASDEKFQFEISQQAYLMGICKHLWNRKFSRDIAVIPLDVVEKSIQIPDDFFRR